MYELGRITTFHDHGHRVTYTRKDNGALAWRFFVTAAEARTFAARIVAGLPLD